LLGPGGVIDSPAPAPRRLWRLAALALAAPPALLAQASPPPVLGGRDAVVAGGFALGALGARTLDRSLAERLQQPEVQANKGLSRTAAVFRIAAQPGVMIALPAVYLVGRLSDDRGVADVGLHGTEAAVVATVGTTIVKTLVGRARPAVNVHDPGNVGFLRGLREEEYRSFPSGHTTVAFAAASALTAEAMRRHPDGGARWAVGVPAYAAAAVVGWSRMYDNRHWASDVVAGAGFGTLSGHAVVRYHHTRPNSRVDRWFLGASLSAEHGVTPLVQRLRVR
jgi:membrane-associated phospholipid phosphatase